METTDDLVVLLDEQESPCGVAPRATVHTTHTPLHLAFSCHVTDEDGRHLLTRRATSKRTWPGVWTNAFCGHPRPGESMEDAVRRHARHELGMDVADLQLVLPSFRYRAVDASGIVENEVCPVFSARAVGPVSENPAEVAEHRWLSAEELDAAAAAAPWALSPWFVRQLAELGQRDGDRGADRLDGPDRHSGRVSA